VCIKLHFNPYNLFFNIFSLVFLIFCFIPISLLRFNSWILREEKESYQKNLAERKLLDDRIPATNHFDFNVYRFRFERKKWIEVIFTFNNSRKKNIEVREALFNWFDFRFLAKLSILFCFDWNDWCILYYFKKQNKMEKNSSYSRS
jgi:hypothetical protein